MSANVSDFIVQLAEVFDDVIVLSIPHSCFSRLSNGIKVKQTFIDVTIDKSLDLLNLIFVAFQSTNLCKVIDKVINTIQTIRTNLSCIVWVSSKQILDNLSSTRCLKVKVNIRHLFLIDTKESAKIKVKQNRVNVGDS